MIVYIYIYIYTRYDILYHYPAYTYTYIYIYKLYTLVKLTLGEAAPLSGRCATPLRGQQAVACKWKIQGDSWWMNILRWSKRYVYH